MEILPGIHIITGYSNKYIIEREDENILIDTGIWWETKKIIKYVKKQLEKPNISKVLLTHGHPDHIEGIPGIVKEFNPEIYIHQEDLAFLTGEKKYEPPESPKMLWKIAYFFLKQPKVKNAKTLEMLPENFFLEHIHFPGHTPGTTVFLYKDRKILFSGDLIVTKRKYPQLPPSKYNWNDELTVKSGKKILDLDFDILMPGHGDPILKNAKQKIIKSPILFSDLSFDNYSV